MKSTWPRNLTILLLIITAIAVLIYNLPNNEVEPYTTTDTSVDEPKITSQQSTTDDPIPDVVASVDDFPQTVTADEPAPAIEPQYDYPAAASDSPSYTSSAQADRPVSIGTDSYTPMVNRPARQPRPQATALPQTTASASPRRENQNYATVDVFYATDRTQSQAAGKPIEYGFGRDKLKYGITKISIPRNHKMGELESPSILRLEFREDPEKHVVLLEIKEHNKTDFFSKLSAQVQSSDKKSAFIFVHGYNVSFEAAARRTGQMTYDLGFDGAPVFYSWPSHSSTAKYTFDEANIEWSKANIEKFLEEFTEDSSAEKIYLVAHSMGNRAVTRAYASLLNKKPELKSRFAEIILAAPDIDADVFKNDIAPAMIQHKVPITLYASSKDLALEASKTIHGGHPRAGDSGDNIVILNGVESIDSTGVKTTFLGHSYYADGRTIISDMYYLFTQGLRAENRAGLRKVQSEEGDYWTFK